MYLIVAKEESVPFITYGNQCVVIFALSKLSIDEFKSLQERRQKSLRTYCPNMYTVQQMHKMEGG